MKCKTRLSNNVSVRFLCVILSWWDANSCVGDLVQGLLYVTCVE